MKSSKGRKDSEPAVAVELSRQHTPINVKAVRDLMLKWSDSDGNYPFFGRRKAKARPGEKKLQTAEDLLSTFLDEDRDDKEELTRDDIERLQTLVNNRWDELRKGADPSSHYLTKPNPKAPNYRENQFVIGLGRLLARAAGKKISDDQIPVKELMYTVENADDTSLFAAVELSSCQPHELVLNDECTTLMHMDDFLEYQRQSKSPILMNCYLKPVAPLSKNVLEQIESRNPAAWDEYLKTKEEFEIRGWITEAVVYKLKQLAEQLAIGEESDRFDDKLALINPTQKIREFYSFFKALPQVEQDGINAMPIPGIEAMNIPFAIGRQSTLEDLLKITMDGYSKGAKFEQECEQVAARLIAGFISPFLRGESGKQFSNPRLNKSSIERGWEVNTKTAARTATDIVMPEPLRRYSKPLADAVKAVRATQSEMKPNKLLAYHAALQNLNACLNPLLGKDRDIDAKATNLAQLREVLTKLRDELNRMKTDPALNRFDGKFKSIRRLWASNASRTYKVAAEVLRQTVMEILEHYREPLTEVLKTAPAAKQSPIGKKGAVGDVVYQYAQLPVDVLLTTLIGSLPTAKQLQAEEKTASELSLSEQSVSHTRQSSRN